MNTQAQHLSLVNNESSYLEKLEAVKKDLKIKFPHIELKKEELMVIVSAVYSKGLDIYENDFYIIPFNGKNQVVFSIEAFRKIARRSYQFGCRIKAINEDGSVTDIPMGKVHGAKAFIKYNGHTSEKSVVFSEYNTGQNLWGKKPFVMISKVAEASILRMCFPETFQGMYVSEEFAEPHLKEVKPAISNETLLKRKEELEMRKMKQEEIEEVKKKIMDILKNNGIQEKNIMKAFVDSAKQTLEILDKENNLDDYKKILEYCESYNFHQESMTQEPKVQESMTQESMTQEPKAQEPQEPAVQEPKAQEPMVQALFQGYPERIRGGYGDE